MSCSAFEHFSFFVEWMLKDRTGLGNLVQDLGDFLFAGPLGSRQCARLLAVCLVGGLWFIPLGLYREHGGFQNTKYDGRLDIRSQPQGWPATTHFFHILRSPRIVGKMFVPLPLRLSCFILQPWWPFLEILW